jgi:cell shape-determining protein MreC
MPRTLLTPARVLFAIVAFLLFSSFARLDVAISIAAPPRNAVRFLLTPATKPLHALAASVRSPAVVDTDEATREKLAADNEKLNARVRQLEEQLRVAGVRIDELSAMRNSSALKLKNVKLIDASVTSWRGGATPIITINRGSSDGIAEGMVVGAGANLVGRVSSVSSGAATVSLISTPGTLLDVRILPAGAEPSPREIVVQCQPNKGSETFWAEAAQSDPIQAGDLAHLRLADNALATQARWRDESAGMIVGKVVRVEDHPDDPKLRTRVIIEPRLKLQSLTRVVVLVPE